MAKESSFDVVSQVDMQEVDNAYQQTARGIDIKALSWDAPQAASGGTVRVVGHIVEGIDQPTAKKINKDVKDLKLKVKVTIEADKLRVSSASKDALQSVIAYLRDQDYGQPLQFTNYR